MTLTERTYTNSPGEGMAPQIYCTLKNTNFSENRNTDIQRVVYRNQNKAQFNEGK